MKHRNWDSMDRIVPYVNNYYRTNHRSPSLRQISAGTGVPRMTVQRMLNTVAESGLIDYDGETVVTEQISKTSEETTPVGIIGSIPCGNLNLEEEAIEEIVNLPVALFGKGNLFLLHASGDSMTGAGIDDGDLVLIRKQDTAEPGEIVVALMEEEATLKRYYPEPENHRIRLHPENSSMEDIYVETCMIQGTAVKVLKDLV